MTVYSCRETGRETKTLTVRRYPASSHTCLERHESAHEAQDHDRRDEGAAEDARATERPGPLRSLT